MSKQVAQLIVDTLQAAGVRHCYGIVGDTLNLIASKIHASEIDWVHMRHEEAGAFAASAEALLTGPADRDAPAAAAPAACISSTGSTRRTAIARR